MSEHTTQAVLPAFGFVPGGHEEHDEPSVLTALSPCVV
eukprot:COSAG06_NODE_69021_length_199_cov_36.090000_1_plen_37_part_01